MSKHTKIAKTEVNPADEELTLHDLLNAVNDGFSDIEARMVTKEEFNQRFDGIESKVMGIESRVSGIESKVISIESKVIGIESKMVTKDYLDEKMNDLRGDLTISLRKEDQKVVTLVSILAERKVLSKKDAQRVMAMELFPRQA